MTIYTVHVYRTSDIVMLFYGYW